MTEIYDFDAERAKRHAEKEQEFGEKPFKFGGETFYVRANVGYLGIKRVAALSEASSGSEAFDAVEYSVISLIDPREDAHARIRRILASDEDPVTFDDLIDLQNWLLGEQTGRPPTQQEPSASTPSSTGPNLTAVPSTGPGEVSAS